MSHSEPTVLALHGFTLGGAMWGEVADAAGGRWLTPDLPFHGGPPVADWNGAVAWVAGTLAAVPTPRILAGYSLGGRLALAAVAGGEPVDGLVIVAASPGIADPLERDARRTADEVLAARIERNGPAAFIDGWLDLPMFAGLGARSDAWRAADRAMRDRHDARSLAGALRVLGQGAQPPMLDALERIDVPVALVVGAADERYVAMARVMASLMQDATVTIVEGAGHAVVGEQPGAVADAVAHLVGRVVESEHLFD
ncbi:alpha/beta fold hydrolase [bacterium]|nr:alpha/beta fold hydrolase [bacterium]